MSVDAVIAEFLADSDLEWEAGASEGEVVVTLPGEKKLRTVVSLVTSPTWLTARAFVVRNPDENHDRVHRFLLAKNLRLPGIAYAVDASGDVYVTGR
ncbi:MAG: YbjN domain-containing protein, partial [Tetrasphaera sp.]|nr:YbjN domain-containing protein [Tetrasphaera sp.]